MFRWEPEGRYHRRFCAAIASSGSQRRITLCIPNQNTQSCKALTQIIILWYKYESCSWICSLGSTQSGCILWVMQHFTLEWALALLVKYVTFDLRTERVWHWKGQRSWNIIFVWLSTDIKFVSLGGQSQNLYSGRFVKFEQCNQWGYSDDKKKSCMWTCQETCLMLFKKLSCFLKKTRIIHWASKETYHFFRATLTKIHAIKINIWTEISFNTP